MLKKIKKFLGIRSLVKVEKDGNLLQLTYDDGSIVAYIGSCTVWYRLPYMTRASNESKLVEFDKYITSWGNPYPTLYLKNN